MKSRWTRSPHSRLARQWGLALACFAFNGITIAQEPSDHAPVVKVQVQQVLVPVMVTDRKGHFVTDLKASDFKIFEDGVEQKLAAFSTQETAPLDRIESSAGSAPQTGQSAALLPINGNSHPRFTYLIAVDTLNSSFGSFGQVREALKNLFKEEQPSDAAYALVAVGRTSRVLQNLTPDLKVVLAPLKSKELTKSILSGEASNFAQQKIDLSNMLEEHCMGGPALKAPGAKTAGEPCGGWEDRILMLDNAATEERDGFTRSFVNDLRTLTEQLARMPGRRVMILISDGFNLQPGRELFELIASYTGQAKILMRNPKKYLLDEMKAIVRLATARNVTFYTLDTRGLYAAPAGGLDISERLQVANTTDLAAVLPAMQSAAETSADENKEPLNYLAASTGGIFYQDSNDLLKGLRQSLADGRQHYLLAYSSSNEAKNGNYRAIKVQVTGRNLLVRAKAGYWAPTTEIATPLAIKPGEPSASVASMPAGNIPPTTPPIRGGPVISSTALPSVIDIPIDELVRNIPELKYLQPASSQDLLAPILDKVGSNVAILFTSFPSVSSREQVTEQRQILQGAKEDQITQDFRYLALASQDRKRINLEEYRTDSKGRVVKQTGLDRGYVITEGFVSVPLAFHPS